MKNVSSEGKTRVFFVILFLLFYFLEVSVSPLTGISFGKENLHIIADFLLALSVVCGMLGENRRDIAVIALIFGAVSDFTLTPAAHFSPVIFFLSAYFSSHVIAVFSRKNAVSATIASLPFLILRSLSGGAILIIQQKGENVGYIIKNILFPELTCNAVAVFFIYIISAFLYKRFKRRFYI